MREEIIAELKHKLCQAHRPDKYVQDRISAEDSYWINSQQTEYY